MLHYILFCLLRGKKVLATKIWCWKKGSAGYQIERNMSSSEAVDPSSNLVSNSEVYSESACDDFIASVIWSEGCDIASFTVQECWQVSAVCIVPLSIVPCGFQIRML